MILRELIRNNFGWKAASLLLATLVWLTINGVIQRNDPGLPPATMTAVRSFPRHSITVMTAAAEIRGFTVSPSDVTVTLQGAPSIIEALSPKHVQVFVDLTDVQSFQELEKKIQVYPPRGVKVLEVVPASVRIVRTPDISL